MKTSIEDLTIGEARQLAALFSNNANAIPPAQGHPFEIGKNYYVDFTPAE